MPNGGTEDLGAPFVKAKRGFLYGNNGWRGVRIWQLMEVRRYLALMHNSIVPLCAALANLLAVHPADRVQLIAPNAS
jgi:hypothetical protein